MNPLCSGRLDNKLPVLRREPGVAKPQHLVAAHAAAPDRAVFRPAIRRDEQAGDQALGDPPVVRDEGQIDVNQRVGLGEPLPGRSDTAKPVDDPFIPAQQVCVLSQELFVRDFLRDLVVIGLELNQ